MHQVLLDLLAQVPHRYSPGWIGDRERAAAEAVLREAFEKLVSSESSNTKEATCQDS